MVVPKQWLVYTKISLVCDDTHQISNIWLASQFWNRLCRFFDAIIHTVYWYHAFTYTLPTQTSSSMKKTIPNITWFSTYTLSHQLSLCHTEMDAYSHRLTTISPTFTDHSTQTVAFGHKTYTCTSTKLQNVHLVDLWFEVQVHHNKLHLSPLWRWLLAVNLNTSSLSTFIPNDNFCTIQTQNLYLHIH